MANPNLTGIYANDFEIIDIGNNCFEVRSKVGSAWPQVGDHTFTIDELAFNYTAPDGGVSSQAVAAITTAEPLALAPQKIEVDEGPSAGDTIGTISATGGTGTLVYAVGAGSNGAVVVSPTGVVTVAADAFGAVAQPTLFDAETTTDFTVPIQVTDDNGTVTETLTVCILNVNEAPTAENIEVTVFEDETSNGYIATALSTIADPDAGDTHSVQISQGNTLGHFTIVGNDLVATQTLDSTVESQYVLTMQVVDSAGNDGFYTITINVVPNSITVTQNFCIPSNNVQAAGVSQNGVGYVLTTAELNATEAGTNASGLNFTIDSTTDVQFRLSGAIATSFTAQDIANGLVSFEFVTADSAATYFANGSTLNPSATFTVTSPSSSTQQTLAITPSPAITIFTVPSAALTTLTTNELNAVGLGSTNAQLNYTVGSPLQESSSM